MTWKRKQANWKIVTAARHQWRSTWPTAIQRSSFVSNKACSKNQSNDTKGQNLPSDWSERDAPLQSFGVEQDSLKEYDGVVNTKWWSVGMIEEHGWGNGYEKKPNENYGRHKTVVWWVELVILHMVLLNDVQKIFVVHQIQYIAVCDATTNSPKLQMCSETVDICSKSMEWSMSCRGAEAPSHHSKQKKTFCFSQFCSVYCLFVSKNDTLRNCGTLFSFLLTKMFFACALCCWSLCCGFAIARQNFHWQKQISTKKLFDVLFFYKKTWCSSLTKHYFSHPVFLFFVIFHG